MATIGDRSLSSGRPENGRGHSSSFCCSLQVNKKVMTWPKLCNGDKEKKKTSAIGIGDIAVCAMQLET